MANHIVSDALFMAQVWKTIKEHGYEFVAENGDPDGIDFVANRIVEEAAQQHPTGPTCAICGEPPSAHHTEGHEFHA
jgi:hypothetical protein